MLEKNIDDLEIILENWWELVGKVEEDKFDYEEFIKLYDQTYRVFSAFSTKTVVSKDVLAILLALQQFCNAKCSCELEHACQLISLTMIDDILLNSEEVEEVRKIKLQGEVYEINYANARVSVESQLKFLEKYGIHLLGNE